MSKDQGIEKTTKDENKYNGWLMSSCLIKRSLAVVGHDIVGYFIIGVVFSVILLIASIIVTIFQ